MTQRSPLNERNTTDKPKGVTRKSASSAKPKREAAASVTVVTKTKTKAEKKAERRKEEQKRRARDARYYNPKTPEYKRMRMYWAICVGVALACAIGSFFLMNNAPTAVTTTLLIASYGAIGIALYIDLVKIRRIRRDYAEQHADSKAETRALKAQKQERAAQLEAQQQQANNKPQKKSLFDCFKKEKAPESNEANSTPDAGASSSTCAGSSSGASSSSSGDSAGDTTATDKKA